MTDWSSFLTLMLSAPTDAWLQFCVIVVGTFILEDATTVICAIAVADNKLSAPVTLSALYVGIALGDVGLYGLGRLAAQHPWARRFVMLDRVSAVKAWMDNRLVSAVISTRFVPGARLPTYTACGFLGVSFRRFAIAVVAGTLVWTSLLFTTAVSLGGIVMTQLGAWRWPAGIALAIVILLVGRWITVRRAGRSGKKEASQ